MILVCGEALVDVFVGDPGTPAATALPARPARPPQFRVPRPLLPAPSRRFGSPTTCSHSMSIRSAGKSSAPSC